MAQGADPQRTGLPVVECRTSACEVQVIGYPEDTVEPRGLQVILPRVMRAQMDADFDSRRVTMMVTSVPDGHVGFIAFMSRKSHCSQAAHRAPSLFQSDGAIRRRATPVPFRRFLKRDSRLDRITGVAAIQAVEAVGFMPVPLARKVAMTRGVARSGE